MGVLDGQAVSAAITNPAFINKNINDTMPNILGFTRFASGPTVADIQAAVNKLYTATGASESQTGTVYNATPGTITNGDSYQTALTTLAGKFDPATGHFHTGAAGDGPLLDVVRSAAVSGNSPITGDLVFLAGSGTTLTQNFNQITIAATGSGGGTTLAVTGNTPLSGAITFIPGQGIELLQVGQDITIAATGGGGGAGLKNYLGIINGINNNGDFELGTTTKWSLFNTTLTGVIPTGTISPGASSITTFAATAVNPLAGIYSLNVASSGALTPGEGFLSDAFTLDLEDHAQVFATKFYYSVLSGATNLNFSGTSSNTWAVYLYDVTNAQWIQPAGVYNLLQSSGGAGIQTGTFQTTSNSTQYQFAILCVNASAGASSMVFDDFFVGPQISAAGAAINDWTDYALVIGADTSAPTPGTTTFNQARWRRVGDSMEIMFRYEQSTTGTSGVGGYSFPLPAGYSIDTNKLSLVTATAAQTDCGSGYVSANADTNNNLVKVIAKSATDLGLAASGNPTMTIGQGNFDLSNSDLIYAFFAQVPIQGWSSNTVMSTDTDTRVVAFSASNQASQSQTSSGTFQVVDFATISFDTHGTYDGTNTYTIPVSGYYRISALITFDTNVVGTRTITIEKNGSAVIAGTLVSPSSVNSTGVLATGTVSCLANDTLRVTGFQDSGGSLAYSTSSANMFFVGERISGPATIAVTETVAARYTVATGVPTDTTQPVDYSVKVFDTHNAVITGASWHYTVPVSGLYAIGICGSNMTGGVNMGLYVNGSLNQVLEGQDNLLERSGTGLVSLFAGDELDIRASSSVTTGSTPEANWITIQLVGNFSS